MSHMDDSREPLSRESGRGRDPARSAGRVRVLATEERPPYTPTFPPLRAPSSPADAGEALSPVRAGVPLMVFGAFERMVAFRYLRARRQEGFVSVIAIFSLLGIALGVATLIIVMSVMNGFRADLLGRILGLNGHLGVYAQTGSLGDFDAEAAKVIKVPGVAGVTPLIEGQVMATSEIGAAGALVRGI